MGLKDHVKIPYVPYGRAQEIGYKETVSLFKKKIY